jgi:hypothetical protein
MEEFKMIGGRIIGNGRYGCIFDPPLICRGDKAPKKYQKGMLGKLTMPDDLGPELHAERLFRSKPEASRYMILPKIDTLCKEGPEGEPALETSNQTESDLAKCPVFIEEGMEKMLHYQVEFGGKSLASKLDSTNVVRNFPFFRFTESLLEVGAYITLNGMIHNDMHFGNIVVKDDLQPRLIDFGRCYLAKDIDENVLANLEARYAPTLLQISPETTTQDGLASGIPFSRIMSDLYHKKSSLRYAEQFFGQSRRQQVAEFKHFWNTSKSVKEKDFTRLWQLYWPVVDSWTIGGVLISILHQLSLSNQFMKSEEWKRKYPVMKAVFCGLLKASPRKRFDAVEALALYAPMNRVVVSSAGKAWLAKKQAQRETSRL